MSLALLQRQFVALFLRVTALGALHKFARSLAHPANRLDFDDAKSVVAAVLGRVPLPLRHPPVDPPSALRSGNATAGTNGGFGNFLNAAFPYVARRLLTDPDPNLRARLFKGTYWALSKSRLPVCLYSTDTFRLQSKSSS